VAASREFALELASLALYLLAALLALTTLLASRMAEYCEDKGGPCTDASPLWHISQLGLAVGTIVALVVTGLALRRVARAQARRGPWSRALIAAAMLIALWLVVVVGFFPTPRTAPRTLPGATPSSYESPATEPGEGEEPAERFLDGFIPYLHGKGDADPVEDASPALQASLEAEERSPRPVRFFEYPEVEELRVTDRDESSAQVLARVVPARPSLTIRLSLIRAEDSWVVERVELF